MNLSYDKKKLSEICQANGITRLSLFGSVLRDDFGAESDIDVLVEFAEGQVPGMFRLVHLIDELSQVFGGRKVDLTTFSSLRGRLKDIVLKEQEVQYEQEAA